MGKKICLMRVSWRAPFFKRIHCGLACTGSRGTPFCGPLRLFIDKTPGTLHSFDAKARTLRRMTLTEKSEPPAKTRPMETIEYAARDGLNIPAYLTRPADTSEPAPTIVLIHGGATDRDYWGWDPEVQILAGQGYAVFQPQFRGSTDFGKKFREGGYAQWGLAMQDDITSGVDYLIAKGIADRKRICIMGASYGGYAALWGLVKTPTLYKCGVSFAGVTDIGRMLTDSSDTNEDKSSREILRWRVAGGMLGQAQLDAVSPRMR